ncbi:ANTAR domain-containing protein [Streptomyces sp. 5-8]|uniref:ANTAR domain-containing protein n=1 Tax=Streptomyces musisoli TaxID=2802280 RepID=A0ABS1NVP3_9ACTN|nr:MULTISPECIES: ANTAR domain-containing protein [Streptomyces]MBL1104176.1 ANTAR domain-containing protein [Streptomyces musisoli]MBY8840249.1 ANTAR domain-containing protein [Streptomyces sp. SP2-10]
MIGRDEQAADQLTALQEEVGHLRQALISHALIDQAIGVVITLGGLRPEQGWDALKHMSQHTNIKLREVARCMVEWPARGRVPEVIRRALPAAVEYARTRADADGREDAREVRCGRPA